MRIDVLTLFPGIFAGYLDEALVQWASTQGLLDIHLHDFRCWCPAGEPPVGRRRPKRLRAGPTLAAVAEIQRGAASPGRVPLLSPGGRRLTESVARELGGAERLILLRGRFDGFEPRVISALRPEELSVGDFVLNGGEVPAMVVIDAAVRHIPGVLPHCSLRPGARPRIVSYRRARS